MPRCSGPPSFAKTISSAENAPAAQAFVCSANSSLFFKANLRGHCPRDTVLQPASRTDSSLYLDSQQHQADIRVLAPRPSCGLGVPPDPRGPSPGLGLATRRRSQVAGWMQRRGPCPLGTLLLLGLWLLLGDLASQDPLPSRARSLSTHPARPGGHARVSPPEFLRLF